MPDTQMTFAFSEEAPPIAGGVPIDESFPEEAANELTAVESFNKHLYRPNTYLHKWWARRSGACFRFVLKQLVTDARKRRFYEAGGLEGVTILDPMMGGGTIVHEAIRLGANVIGVDVDPIPVLQARATLRPPELGKKVSVFREFLTGLRGQLSAYFTARCPMCDRRAGLQFMLYGLRKECACGVRTLVDSFVLREGPHGAEVRVCPRCQLVHASKDHRCGTKGPSLLERGARNCPNCGEGFRDCVAEDFSRRYRPIAVVGLCQVHGQFYRSPTQEDISLLKKAVVAARAIRFPLDLLRVPHGPKSDDLIKRGIRHFSDLFTPRQQIYLARACALVGQFEPEHRLWLSLLVSTSLEFNSLLCGYKGVGRRRAGAIRHVFAHHAYTFPYTALENNPVLAARASGTLERLFHDRIVKAGRWAEAPVERAVFGDGVRKVSVHGEQDFGTEVRTTAELAGRRRCFLVLQSDARGLGLPAESVDYVVTDPPYYDNVQYSDLSSFFRSWLSTFIPDEADWSYAHLSSAVVDGCRTDGGSYGEALTQIWRRCFTFLKKDRGRLIFTFHHWRSDAWAQVTLSLRRACFVLVNRYVVLSENPRSVHIRNLKALKHDCILVLKPRTSPGNTRDWTKPGKIETADSYEFCKQCGAAVGWFLSRRCDDGSVERGWRELLGERQ